MDTASYYTLSTIAQTLVGAFGFILAAAIFRIGLFEKTIPDLEEQVRAIVPVIRDAEDSLQAQEDFGEDLKMLLADTKSERQRMLNIVPDLHRAWIATAWTIVACLVGLPLVGLLSHVEWGFLIAWGGTLPVVAAALWCLWLYRPIINAIVKIPGLSPPVSPIPPPGG
jgi:hypothetical protein